MMTMNQENVIREALDVMNQKNGYANTSGFLEGVLLTVLELYVRDRDVETVVRSFINQKRKLEQVQ